MGFYQPLYSQDNIENGHEWVDLGLSVKWATCNVGAKTAEEYGNYYAWGETKPKDAYSGSSSVTYGLNNSDLKAQGIIDEDGNLTSSYDAAAANWGGDWKMPTIAEMNELESKCTWEWIKQNGVRGYKVTGPNGNFIFLPAAGCWSYTSFTDGSCGYTYYWSSTHDSSTSNYTAFLKFDSGSHGVFYGNICYYGCSVRPVREWKDGETPSVGVSVNSTDITAVVNTYVSSPISEITARGFYWGTNPNPTEADNNVVLENTTGSIAKVIANLTPNTTYYVKAYAANSSGTSYSEVVSFTTLAESAFTDILSLCKDKNIPIEVNGYGILKNQITDDKGILRYQYPYEDFWQFAKSFGVKVVCNSDAHRPEDALYGAFLAREYANKLGIEPISHLH